MATTPEGKVKNKLDRQLRLRGVWYFNPQAGPFGRAGIPDKILCVVGRLVGIECKADKSKKPTPLQMKAMAEIERAGGRCFVVYDDDTMAEALAYIDGLRGIDAN